MARIIQADVTGADRSATVTVEASGGFWIPVEDVELDLNLEFVWTVVDPRQRK